MSDSHLVAVVNKDLGDNKFEDQRTAVTRWPIKKEGRLSTQSSKAQLKIR
jgi:hypothetical protein